MVSLTQISFLIAPQLSQLRIGKYWQASGICKQIGSHEEINIQFIFIYLTSAIKMH